MATDAEALIRGSQDLVRDSRRLLEETERLLRESRQQLKGGSQASSLSNLSRCATSEKQLSRPPVSRANSPTGKNQ
jgi:hypothetical protein